MNTMYITDHRILYRDTTRSMDLSREHQVSGEVLRDLQTLPYTHRVYSMWVGLGHDTALAALPGGCPVLSCLLFERSLGDARGLDTRHEPLDVIEAAVERVLKGESIKCKDTLMLGDFCRKVDT